MELNKNLLAGLKKRIDSQLKPGERLKLFNGDCLDVLKKIPDESVDAIVTDPPYGLSNHSSEDVIECLQCWIQGKPFVQSKKGFMGKEWDSWVPGPEIWKECIRVLKPGGHLLAFAGTRTQDLMGISIRLAGAQLRDEISYFGNHNWIYGCYSEDTECLTRIGWKKYSELSLSDEVLQWNSDSNTLSWTNPKEIIILPYSGKMIHFKNRHTDQLITPNHRVYGKFRTHARNPKSNYFEVKEAFEIKTHWQTAFPLAGILEGNIEVDGDLAYLIGWWLTDAWIHGDGKAAMFSQSKPEKMAKLKAALIAADCSFSEYIKDAKKETHQDEHTFYVRGNLADYLISEWPKRKLVSNVLDWKIESRKRLFEGLMDGDGSTKADQHAHTFWTKDVERIELVQLLAMSLGYRTIVNYNKGCVYFNVKTNTTQIQSTHRQKPKDYNGMVWCLRVDDGAFVVRRNGKIFISGNSGFPKSQDVSKAIDREAGVEGEVVGQLRKTPYSTPGTNDGWKRPSHNTDANPEERNIMNLTAPATEEAKKWNGWGSAIKPAHDPILLFQKPIKEQTIAQNVIKHGTGALNIDACRITLQNGEENPSIHRYKTTEQHGNNGWGHVNRGGQFDESTEESMKKGRWPANVIFSHHPECIYKGIKEVGTGEDVINSSDTVGPVSEGYCRPNASMFTHKLEGGVRQYGKEVIDDDCHCDCPVKILDEQSGISKSPLGMITGTKSVGGILNSGMGYRVSDTGHGDSGGASRFFYCAKCSPTEREIKTESYVLKDNVPNNIVEEILQCLTINTK